MLFPRTPKASSGAAPKAIAPAAAGPTAAKAAPAATPAAAPPATPEAPVEKPAVTTGLGEDVDRLSSKSPTLVDNVKTMQKDGWTIEYGPAGGGSFCDSTAKKIVIDQNEKNDAPTVVQTLAHESGHALYKQDPYVDGNGRSREEFVSKNTMRLLKDEGEATLVNIKVRDEIVANGGKDIGVAGSRSWTYTQIAKKYPDPKDRDKARTEIANEFADNENPSTDASKTYRQYYAKTYEDHWDKHHKPSP